MHPAIYTQFNELEGTHWWFVARRELVASLLRTVAVPAGPALDVGCGTGGTLSLLGLYGGALHGIDRSPEALAFTRAKYPQAHLVEGDINELAQSFQKGTFALATVFNVLYHSWVRDEAAVLRQLHGLMAPGGVVVVTEPAFRFLMREHDDQVMGRTRYRRGDIEKLLVDAGFVIERSTYFNAISFFPAALLGLIYKARRALGRTRTLDAPVHEVEQPRPAINKFALALMGGERALIALLGAMPFGVTVACVARKP